MKSWIILALPVWLALPMQAQDYDSLYELNEKRQPLKLRHAEPIYIDLIRDLGAHKGEREWNVGFGMVDKLRFDKYLALVEYEWAPIDRLGLEVELPITIYSAAANGLNTEKPSNRIESIKTAAQWTFHVSEKKCASFALGYLNELEFTDLNSIAWSNAFRGNLVNPFFIVAKQLGHDFHSLIYSGPRLNFNFDSRQWTSEYQLNASVHYMIPGTRNFIGVEFNSDFLRDQFEMVIRPQMRLVIHESMMIGIVQGIPVSKERERLSTFLRLIYEPRHK
ncbi:MAG: phosphoribosylformylglycinamidine synthase [Cyclobacteriaceae bacterium]|nr:phosphoribosylformylglycinamidine synthase [Cyclobacteriaceae bacterium]